jgi:hypothetical protein
MGNPELRRANRRTFMKALASDALASYVPYMNEVAARCGLGCSLGCSLGATPSCQQQPGVQRSTPAAGARGARSSTRTAAGAGGQRAAGAATSAAPGAGGSKARPAEGAHALPPRSCARCWAPGRLPRRFLDKWGEQGHLELNHDGEAPFWVLLGGPGA